MPRLSTLLPLLVPAALADVYFQFPCGSNNRLNEAPRDRDNAKRLFDSQNNQRAGCNKNDLEFFVGSELDLAWTVQHSCGPKGNLACQQVLQYTCDKDNRDLRDGQTTETIPDAIENDQCQGNDCRTDRTYAYHETQDSYLHSRRRERNQGLFKADQNLGGKTSAIFTRQDNKGTRYGYETPEERDYYPYWMPSIWTDIAIMVDDVSRCSYYRKNSENVQGRGHCHVPRSILLALNKNKSLQDQGVIPIEKSACFQFGKEMGRRGHRDAAQIKWKVSNPKPAEAPDCVVNPNSRDNHHGAERGSRYFAGYKWKIPDQLAGQKCSIRIRYNISSPEIANYGSDYWQVDASDHIRNQNDDRAKVSQTGPTNYYKQFGFSDLQGIRRGYRHQNDQELRPMPNNDLRIKMSYNTDQLGRTFEDRTFLIKFKARPSGLSRNAKIHNLVPIGKMGNPVQVYPNFEIMFHPQNLVVNRGDYVHIQASGSDAYLPRSIDESSQVNEYGHGLDHSASKFRTNIVPIDSLDSHRVDMDVIKHGNIFGITNSDVAYGKYKTAKKMTEGLALDGVYGGAEYGSVQPGMQQKMNVGKEIVPFRTDFGLIRLNKKGVFHFMDSHNHRFGTRTVKGSLTVN